MKKTGRILQILFAVPWIVFGVQHFMYAEFVATLVPKFMPFKLFWAYFTGTAMIAAGISLIVDRLSRWAAIMLGAMLIGFILLIHVFVVSANPLDAKIWTRPVQDVALAAACFLLASNSLRTDSRNQIFENVATISRYVFAAMLIAFGVQQFMNLDFLTAKIPAFLPAPAFWASLTGAAMVFTGIGVIINRQARRATIALGIYMLAINLLNYGCLLANEPRNPVLWTGAMLNFAITFGVLILAEWLPRED